MSDREDKAPPEKETPPTAGMRRGPGHSNNTAASAKPIPIEGKTGSSLPSINSKATGQVVNVGMAVERDTVLPIDAIQTHNRAAASLRKNKHIMLLQSSALLAMIVENLERSEGSNLSVTVDLFSSRDGDFLNEIRLLRQLLERFVTLLEAEEVNSGDIAKTAVDWGALVTRLADTWIDNFAPGVAKTTMFVVSISILDAFGISIDRIAELAGLLKSK